MQDDVSFESDDNLPTESTASCKTDRTNSNTMSAPSPGIKCPANHEDLGEFPGESNAGKETEPTISSCPPSNRLGGCRRGPASRIDRPGQAPRDRVDLTPCLRSSTECSQACFVFPNVAKPLRRWWLLRAVPSSTLSRSCTGIVISSATLTRRETRRALTVSILGAYSSPKS